jgi:hypothetical protein
MLKITNIRELNGEVCGGFNLSHCDFLDKGSNLVREPHYQIQFDKCPPFGNAQPACLTIGVDSDSKGRYFCKLYYATTNNVIWQEWLPKSTIAQRDALLRSIASILHTHINRI